MVDVQCWMLVVIPAIQMMFINYYGKISLGITIPIGKEHVKIYLYEILRKTKKPLIQNMLNLFG